ncbi:hypothetical protein [Solitalea lacus]|uniref:hypothetical protein n=1 Tax=Solitalea lacus TaxID=2911172 RepID=UPI001EDBABFE|nr:hypothetical protein [Solitalea lacus]UKJ08591.1 hypothetical protein L2B55_05350 [Solitalea lacus]
MQKSRYLFNCLFMLITLTSTCFAGGLSAWEECTPNGNKLYHDGEAGGLIELTVKDSSIWFKHFYFYKRHIIAEIDSTFYIVNEKNNTIEEFNNESDFKSTLNKKKLIPVFITRWYNVNYGIDKFWIPFSLVLLPIPFLMPIIWLLCLISLLFKSNKILLLRKLIVFGYPLIGILILIIYNFPQSF